MFLSDNPGKKQREIYGMIYSYHFLNQIHAVRKKTRNGVFYSLREMKFWIKKIKTGQPDYRNTGYNQVSQNNHDINYKWKQLFYFNWDSKGCQVKEKRIRRWCLHWKYLLVFAQWESNTTFWQCCTKQCCTLEFVKSKV